MSPEEIQAARALLASKKTEDRIRGVQRLARVDDLDAQRLLFKALDDRVNYVATLAAEALAEGADVRLLPELIARFAYLSEDGLARDPGCHVRGSLAKAFGRMEVHGAIDTLRVGLKTVQIEFVAGKATDTAAHLRGNCARALAQVRAPDALRDISLLLFDRGDSRHAVASKADSDLEQARKAAAQALAHLPDPNAIVPLAIKLTHPDGEAPEVLQECMEAVVALEDERGLELLQPYLHHHDQHLAAFACLMIARMRAPEAPFLIRDAIAGLFGNPLEAALLALSTLRTDEAQQVLDELAHSGRKDIKGILDKLKFG